MRNRLVLLALAVFWVAPAWGAVSLGERWFDVQKALNRGDAQALKNAVSSLMERGEELRVRHMGPYARALATWAAGHSGPVADLATKLALEVDPGDPSGWFVAASRAWENGRYPRAVGLYVRAWARVGSNAVVRRAALVSLVPFLAVPLGLVLFCAVTLNTARYLPQIFHDAGELGRLFFKGSDAFIFAVVVMTFPVFAGLGPVWLVAFLFSLSWAYLGKKEWVFAVVATILLAGLVPGLVAWERGMLRRPELPLRVLTCLQDRSLDPSAVQELSNLDGRLGKYAEYHLLLGAMLRLHDDPLSARVQFQKAALAAPADPRPLIFMGTLSLSEGNLPEAIQSLSAAVKKDPANAVAYYDLALAYEQAYRFQEADQMRKRARELAGQDFARGGGTRAAAVPLDPPVGRRELRDLERRVPPAVWSAAGLAPAGIRPLRLVLDPFPFAFLATGLLGIVLLLLRRRWMWRARACSRCGKVFCPRCKTATESETYCSQCISVFLKRGHVAVEQQAAKLDQIKRWERRRAWVRRCVALVCPGGGLVLKGSWLGGVVAGLATAVSLFLVLGWLPAVMTEIEPMARVVPIQAALSALALIAWAWAVGRSWSGR